MPAPKRLQRAERRVEILESMMEERNREFSITQEQAFAVHTYLLGLQNIIPGAVISASSQGMITRVNRGVRDLLGCVEAQLIAKPLASIWPGADDFLQRRLSEGSGVIRDEVEWIAETGEAVPVLLSMSVYRDAEGNILSFVLVGVDLRDRRRLEVELRHAQKLEALGHLAAGVAHEINTPMQFIGDNLYFIQDACVGLKPLFGLINELRCNVPVDIGQRLEAACKVADLDFILDRLPKAVESALEGVTRVSRIVEAMKAFSHTQSQMGPVDLNKSLTDTLTVARNEYKYVAEIETDFGNLPPVVCNGGDMSQVFLNLIVNAAQAIESKLASAGAKGVIRIRTAREDDYVVIAISDDGGGIPAAIHQRIFDPFFTTKEVGKGTGQGLAISRSIVVDRHGGSITFDSEIGIGTTFCIRLPINGRENAVTQT